MRAPTLLPRLKIQKLRGRWPAYRQPAPDNQRQDKHVESPLALYSDGGSTPPISTRKAGTCQLFLWRVGRYSGLLCCLGHIPRPLAALPRPAEAGLRFVRSSTFTHKIAGAKVIVFVPMRLQNHCCGSKLWPFCARRRLRYSLEAQIDGKHQYKRKKDDSPTQID